MTEARRKTPARLAAVGLFAAIAWLVLDLAPVIAAERRLRLAEAAIDDDPVRGFEALGKCAGADGLSRRQKERVTKLGREALERVRGLNPILRSIGPWPFEPGAPARPYVTATPEIMLGFELPAGLSAVGARIRVASGTRNLAEVRLTEDGMRGRADVPLAADATVVADVDLVCPLGVCGTLVQPIAHGLRLVRKSRGPAVVLRAGEQVFDFADGAPRRLQVDRGTPIHLDLEDELGLDRLDWRVDGTPHDPWDWSRSARVATRGVDLPADVTAAASDARQLEFKASNALAVPTNVSVELLVREPNAPPVARARIERDEVREGSVVHSSERALTLAVVMAKGERPEDLVVTWDGRSLSTRTMSGEAAALLATDVEGKRELVLKVRNADVLRCAVVFDWTPPAVAAVVDPGGVARDLEVRRAVHEVPVGSIVRFTVSDPLGIDSVLTECHAEGPGLEEVPDPEPASRRAEASTTWSRTYRCAQPGESSVRLVGYDVAGNRTTIHEYKIRIADPMHRRKLLLNGVPFGGSDVVYARRKQLVLRSEGGMELDGLVFVVLDPDHGQALLGTAALERSDRPDTKTATVDLASLAPSGRQVVAVLSRGGRELAKSTVVVDFEPPRFQVLHLEPAPGGGDVLRYFASPGQEVSLTVTDDVGVDVSSVSAVGGAEIVKTAGSGTEVAVWIKLPAVFEEPVVLTAFDSAKNQGELRFEAVSKEDPASKPVRPVETKPAPAPRPIAESGPALPDPAPALTELQGHEKVVHPQLGTFLLVPVREGAGAPFYIGEREVAVKDFRVFVKDLQGRAAPKREALVKEAAAMLSRNTNVYSKGEDEPCACITADLAKAYAEWANEVGREQGVWRLPTASQWRLAAGRATYSEAVFPTTNAFQNGSDLTNEGNGGALFGHDYQSVQEAPKRALQPGAYGIRAMAGGVYEWVLDQKGPRLIGGSLVSPKAACRLDAPLRSAGDLEDYERGLRLVLFPRARR